jgi:hypothetical protein
MEVHEVKASAQLKRAYQRHQRRAFTAALTLLTPAMTINLNRESAQSMTIATNIQASSFP